MMKIVLAFDSFKGCMTAEKACHTAALAIHDVMPDADVVECPLSDGGEGLVDCIEQMLPVRRVMLKAHDPLMNIIDASYVIDEASNTAYMEMAATSGLTLVPEDRRNPMLTTTYGVGEMIIDALRRHCKEIVIGIGGSATCDAGKGMIQCLEDNGFLDADGRRIDGEWSKCRFTVASDVNNPLYGEHGAACVFAPQKGATPEQVALLDEQLQDFARETEKAGLAHREIDGRLIDLAFYPGAGAAGGLGYGLMAYLNATLKPGIDIILDIKDFDSVINHSTLIITGEGKSDNQTLMGKVPHGVLKRAKSHNIPVWLLSGCIEDRDSILTDNFDFVRSINRGDNRPLNVLMQTSVACDNLSKTIIRYILDKRVFNGLFTPGRPPRCPGEKKPSC